jgi:hypothetical protein
MSVSMACKLEFICARVSGKDEGTGIEDGDWERADEGFVFETIDASCSWRLVGIVAEVGGGRWRKPRDDVFIFCLIWLWCVKMYLSVKPDADLN